MGCLVLKLCEVLDPVAVSSLLLCRSRRLGHQEIGSVLVREGRMYLPL